MNVLGQVSKRLSQNGEGEEHKTENNEARKDIIDEGSYKESHIIPTSGWIRKYRKRPGNEWLEEIERDFLNDYTNLVGLEDEISHLSQGLHTIMSDGLYLDCNGNSRIHTKTEGKYLEAAETLYSLVHVRYLFSNKGFAKVLQNYSEGKYGMCPRHYCIKSYVLPIGISDRIGQGKVKVYCPSCEDIYHASLPTDQAPDGACFGRNLPQMFFMTYPKLRPHPSIGHYVPRLYGFRIHTSAYLDDGQSNEATKVSKQNHKTTSTRSRVKRRDKLEKLKEDYAAQQNKRTIFPQTGQEQCPIK